jgi:hypothetical protein
MRRCQRLPDVTHPVDPTRPLTLLIKEHARPAHEISEQKRTRLGESVLSRRRALTSLPNGLLDSDTAHTRTPANLDSFPLICSKQPDRFPLLPLRIS